MANTGNFIYNSLKWEEPKGFPVGGSPFTIPLDATAEDIVEIVGGQMTLSIAQSFIDSRVIIESPQCTPTCLPNLVTNEYPLDAVFNLTVGESVHGYLDLDKVCVTGIKY